MFMIAISFYFFSLSHICLQSKFISVKRSMIFLFSNQNGFFWLEKPKSQAKSHWLEMALALSHWLLNGFWLEKWLLL